MQDYEILKTMSYKDYLKQKTYKGYEYIKRMKYIANMKHGYYI